MGRKPLPLNMRAQPISFSLKPHLIEKIDLFCEDHHFNRSKFLMEAVTQYMLKTEMKHTTSYNVREMTLDQKVALGFTALKEANRDNIPINGNVIANLRNELPITRKDLNSLETHDLTELMLHQQQWACPHCEKTTSSLQGMKKHMRYAHDYHHAHWDA